MRDMSRAEPHDDVNRHASMKGLNTPLVGFTFSWISTHDSLCYIGLRIIIIVIVTAPTLSILGFSMWKMWENFLVFLSPNDAQPESRCSSLNDCALRFFLSECFYFDLNGNVVSGVLQRRLRDKRRKSLENRELTLFVTWWNFSIIDRCRRWCEHPRNCVIEA